MYFWPVVSKSFVIRQSNSSWGVSTITHTFNTFVAGNLPACKISLKCRLVAIVALFLFAIGCVGCAVTGNKTNSGGNPGAGGNPGGGGTSHISITPDPVNFGSVTVGSKDTQTMQLSNMGSADLTVTKVQAAGGGFAVAGLSLPLTLAAGQSTPFTSSFKPTCPGNSSGSISITSNADGLPTIVNLSGMGTTSTVQLTPNPTSLSFGNVSVGTTSTKDVKLTNTGNTDVAITNVTVAGAGLATGGGVNVMLAPNQSTNVAISFDPTSAAGVQGTLSIASNAPPLQIPISGQGTAQAVQHSVSLRWSESSTTVSGYNVYRGTVSGGPYRMLNGSLDSSTSYIDQTVASGKTYYYVVTSVGTEKVESAFSQQITATIPTP